MQPHEDATGYKPGPHMKQTQQRVIVYALGEIKTHRMKYNAARDETKKLHCKTILKGDCRVMKRLDALKACSDTIVDGKENPRKWGYVFPAGFIHPRSPKLGKEVIQVTGAGMQSIAEAAVEAGPKRAGKTHLDQEAMASQIAELRETVAELKETARLTLSAKKSKV